jgi:hypothetical protein
MQSPKSATTPRRLTLNIRHTVQSRAARKTRKKISLRIRGGACYQLFSSTQRDPACRTLLIGLEWKSLKNWPLGGASRGARIYKREGATWQLRSKILGSGLHYYKQASLAREQATAIIYLYIHWVISSYMDHISMYALCHVMPWVGRRHRAALGGVIYYRRRAAATPVL